MHTAINVGGSSDGISRSTGISWRGFEAEEAYERRPMKQSLSRLLAYKALRWWREMMSDLVHAENSVMSISERLHRIAGRTHVLEMEAYGEIQPRKTLPPHVPWNS